MHEGFKHLDFDVRNWDFPPKTTIFLVFKGHEHFFWDRNGDEEDFQVYFSFPRDFFDGLTPGDTLEPKHDSLFPHLVWERLLSEEAVAFGS